MLEPYAARVHWRLPAPAPAGHWERLVCAHLEAFARGCDEAGARVIGHIKALSLRPGGGYLRVSVVGPALPAAVEGRVPAGRIELELTLNAVVYGLGRDRVERLARATAVPLAEQWQAEVTIEAV